MTVTVHAASTAQPPPRRALLLPYAPRPATIHDLPDDALALVFTAAGLGRAAATRQRARLCTVCAAWRRVLGRPEFWARVELDTSDFAGGPPAFAAALLRCAARAGPRLERVTVVARPTVTRASADVDDDAAFGEEEEVEDGGSGSGRTSSSGSSGGDGSGPGSPASDAARRPRSARPAADSSSSDDEDDPEGAAEAVASPAAPRAPAGGERAHAHTHSSHHHHHHHHNHNHRRPPPRVVYGDGVRLEPFPGSRAGFSGPGELESWLRAAAATAGARLAAFVGGGGEGRQPQLPEPKPAAAPATLPPSSSSPTIAAVHAAYQHADADGTAALFGGGEGAQAAKAAAAAATTTTAPTRPSSSSSLRRPPSTSTLWGPDVVARLEAAVKGKPFGGRAGVRRWRRRWGWGRGSRGRGGPGGTALTLADRARILAARARRAGRAVGGVLAAAADLATAAAAFALAARLLMAAVSTPAAVAGVEV